MKSSHKSCLQIGWATRSITPDCPVVLAGQFRMRISEGVDGPVTVTALAISTDEPNDDSVIFVSCDLGGFRHRWYDENDFFELCCQTIRDRCPHIDVEKVILNATHTHTAPNSLIGRYGDAEPEGVMTAEEYFEFFRNRLADAVGQAWEDRKPAALSYGLGTAVVGHNRRATYFEQQGGASPGAIVNGLTRMYGDTSDPNFSHIEGYEDHFVNLLYTWDEKENLTGVVVNIACPSQETESGMEISADFWHEVREEIRQRHGKHIQVAVQCSAAGDQSPHRLWYKKAQERMLQVRGLTMRQEIGRRVANAVDEALPVAKATIEKRLVLKHVVKKIEIPRRIVTDEEAKQVRADLAKLQEEHKAGKSIYRIAMRCRRALDRYEKQKESPCIPMHVHVVRIGDVAFATNRFELFMDHGIQIKARSPAVQTFLIQLAADDGWNGTYLPSHRAVSNMGYGSSVYDNEVGPDAGRVLVNKTVDLIQQLWA